jgi:RNA polymerase sigma factor (sigma-70 family)
MDLNRGRTDPALAARIAAGDDRAFEELAARHRGRLVGFAAGRLGERRDEAEDVVQEALLRAYRAIRGGKVPEHTSAYLHTIVANCCSDRHAAAGRRPTVPLLEEATELAGADDPHAAAVRRAEVESTVTAIRQLPDAQRQAFVGYELEGRSYRDLGDEHGWSLSATKSLLWRARDNLAGARAGWGAVAGLPTATIGALRASVTGWADRATSACAILPHGGEALGCVAAVAALAAVPGGELAGAKAQHDHAPRHHHAAAAHAAGTTTTPQAAVVEAAPARVAVARAGGPAAAGRHVAIPARLHVSAGDVLRRCADGTSLRGVPITALARARRDIPTDLAEYTNCSGEIDHAILRAGRAAQRP